jgi:hypothetical protein
VTCGDSKEPATLELLDFSSVRGDDPTALVIRFLFGGVMTSSRSGPRWDSLSCRLLAVSVAALAVSVFATAHGLVVGVSSPGSRWAKSDVESLEPLERVVDFGVLRQGESREHRCWFENNSATRVTIEQITSSCNCVSIKADPKNIEPGARCLLTIQYDGEKDKHFTGSLGIVSDVMNETGNRIGRIRLRVEVARGNTS